MIFIVWDYSNSALKDKQYKQKTSPKSYKTQVKILVNPEIAIGLWTTEPLKFNKYFT